MRRDTVRARVDELRKRRNADEQVDRAFKLGVLKRAHLETANLLSDPHWQAYVERVSAMNEMDQSALDGMVSMSDTLIYMTPEMCHAVEFQLAVLVAKIQARNECIQIPQEILGTTAESD